jgi:hypothetical protein
MRMSIMAARVTALSRPAAAALAAIFAGEVFRRWQSDPGKGIFDKYYLKLVICNTYGNFSITVDILL